MSGNASDEGLGTGGLYQRRTGLGGAAGGSTASDASVSSYTGFTLHTNQVCAGEHYSPANDTCWPGH